MLLSLLPHFQSAMNHIDNLLIFLVHYFTKKESDNIFRTSIWKKENNNFKILFHQASLYKDEINLIEF